MVEHTHARPRVGESTPHGAHRDSPESHVTHASDTDSPQRGAFGFTARLVSHTHDITVHRRAHRAPHDRSSRLSRPRAVASPYPSRELSRSSRCVSALSRPTPLSVSPSPAAVQALHVLASIHNYTTWQYGLQRPHPTPHQDCQHQPYVSAHCQKRLSNSSCEAASSVSR